MNELWANPWVRRGAYVVGGTLLGLLLERAVIRRLRVIASRSDFRWDDILAEAFRGVTTVCLTAAGIYLALGVGTIPPSVDAPARKVLVVVVIAAFVLAAMRAAAGTVAAATARSALGSPTLIPNLARMVVAILGFFVILGSLDIDVTPLLTALGIGGLAVALALQDTLGNLFAGIQIIFSRQVRPGDYVRLSSGEEGFVADVKARNTTIQSFPDGNMVVVPNSTLASSIVKNFSLPQDTLWVSTQVGVSYDSDLEHVEEVTLDVSDAVLREVQGGVAGEPALVRFHTFGDSSIDFEVRMMVKDFTSQGYVRHEFIKRLHARFHGEGIEIPFPIRTLVLRSPLPDASPDRPVR